ncbi:MAG: hypothetical protein U5K75_09880 [Ahrensia sp.]|nr:hypothetical protein [Ahrensia sp.]
MSTSGVLRLALADFVEDDDRLIKASRIGQRAAIVQKVGIVHGGFLFFDALLGLLVKDFALLAVFNLGGGRGFGSGGKRCDRRQKGKGRGGGS